MGATTSFAPRSHGIASASKPCSERCYDAGDIELGVSAGKYGVACEEYYTDDELATGGVCRIPRSAQQAVRASKFDWVVAQPVGLTDTVESRVPFVSLTGDVRAMAIGRRQVATFLADATETRAYDRHVVALS